MSREFQAYIMVCQVLSTPALSRFLHVSTKSDPIAKSFFSILNTIYGVWNLDFFRSVYPPFCLHRTLTALQVLSLDYIVAVYPMFLILITYVCVALHDHSRIVIWLWSPFHRCIAKFRREWDLRKSLVDVFAIFILLSYVKILNVSCDILVPTSLYDVNGNRLQHLYLYYNGTIQYFERDHIYFAVLALTMCLIFNFIPFILLMVYPCRCFQRCLNHLRLQSQALTHFMDAFQGNFKTQPYDCRHFAALYLFLRIMNLLILYWTRSALYIILSPYAFTLAALVITALKPYPKLINTTYDIVLILSVSLAGFLYSFYFTATVLDTFHSSQKSLIIVGLLLSFPALYAVLHYLCRQAVPKLINKFKTLKNVHQERNEAIYGSNQEISHQYGVNDEHTPLLS